MDLPVKEWKVIEDAHLSKLVEESYGVPFSYQQLFLLGQDSINYETFQIIDLDRIDEYDFYEPEGYFEEEFRKFEEWKQLKAPEGGNYEQVHWRTQVERGEIIELDVRVLWSDMVEKGLLDEGEYVIHVWW